MNLRFQNRVSSQYRNKQAPAVFFNLNDTRGQLYYFSLIFLFHEADYNIYLKHNFIFIANCFKAIRHAFKLPHLKIVYSFPKELRSNCIYITDQKIIKVEGIWKKVIRINFDVYSPKSHNGAYLTLPFYMSPDQYISGRYKHVEQLRSERKKMRIFFSGNQDRQAYDHPIITEFFHKLSRIKMLDAVTAELNSEELLLIENKEQWEFKESYEKKMVINRWTWSPEISTNLESRVSNELWLETLAKSDFFLATPGIRMPLCFNVIEAMSVGAIPILEYAEYFDPPLEHLKNCVIFNGKEDLLTQIRNALKMEKEKINLIKKGVLVYYDEYLRPQNFAKKIDRNSTNILSLYVNATEISYQEYLKNKSKHCQT